MVELILQSTHYQQIIAIRLPIAAYLLKIRICSNAEFPLHSNQNWGRSENFCAHEVDVYATIISQSERSDWRN